MNAMEPPTASDSENSPSSSSAGQLRLPPPELEAYRGQTPYYRPPTASETARTHAAWEKYMADLRASGNPALVRYAEQLEDPDPDIELLSKANAAARKKYNL